MLDLNDVLISILQLNPSASALSPSCPYPDSDFQTLLDQYKIFECKDEYTPVLTGYGLNPTFLASQLNGTRGYAEAVSSALGQDEVQAPPYVSNRTLEVIYCCQHKRKPLLCPWTGNLSFAYHSLGREWYYYRSNDGRFCIVGTMSETAGHPNRDTVWIFPHERLILYINNGYGPQWIKKEVISLLSLLVNRGTDVIQYLSESILGVAVSDFWCPHISHNLWNCLSGWKNVLDVVDPAAIARYFVFDGQSIFGKLEDLFPSMAQIEQTKFTSDNDVFDIMLRDKLLITTVKDHWITDSLSSRIVKLAFDNCTKYFLEGTQKFKYQHNPIVLISIRLNNRSWLEQESGFISVMKELQYNFPNIGFIIDGLSKDAVMGWTTVWMSLADDQRMATHICDAATAFGLPVINGVGVLFSESIVLNTLCDCFIAPIGSSMALSKWIANKPGLAFSNRAVLDPHGAIFRTHCEWDRNRENIRPTFYIPYDSVEDEAPQHGMLSRSNFHLDWKIILQNALIMMRQCLPGGVS